MQGKIREMFRRKFELYDIQLNNDKLTLNFRLSNFIEFRKRKFTVMSKGERVPFAINFSNKKSLEITIDIKYIVEGNNSIEFYYNKKHLWLVAYENLKDIFEIENKIYLMKVNKNLLFKQYKTNFEFTGETKEIQIDQTDNDFGLITSKDNLESLILLNKSKQIEISIENDKINLNSIQQSTNNQHFKVYAVYNQKIYKAKFPQKYINENLVFNFIWKNNELLTSLRSIFVDEIHISSFVNDSILRMSANVSENFEESKFVSFGVIDNDLNSVQKIPTTIDNMKIYSEIPMNSFDNIKTKKVIAIYKTEEYVEKYYILNSKKSLNYNNYYYYSGEIYHLQILKKNGITMFSSKPNIKMGINSVNEKSMNIYFQPNKIYETFQYYITFEERSSQNSYEMPISRGEQKIDIPYEEIQKLKTSPKNIIDIFITIYNEKTLIRKEKVKYRAGTYKKDNYLAINKRNINNKRVYYMITLTPFKNIKMESFEVDNTQLSILENTEKRDNVWLIGERTDTAQNNGVQFFNWLQNNTEIDAYYVIDASAKDYEKIRGKKNVIEFGSLTHFEVSAKAKVLVSTHDLENILPFKTANGFWGYENTIKVFLQHGVLGRKNVEYNKKYYDLPFNIFDVSSTSEKYDIVMNQLGYEEEDVYVTGLPRFDNLPLKPNKTLKKILIMPTWRDWLNSDFAFNNSEYMQRYLNLINNKKLKRLCELYNLEVNFYPHYRAQEFFKYHLDNINSEINSIELGEQTVQDLLIEHDILITDYSSVSFDFSYMNKPVIFYHFDVDQFFRKGILRPIEETFIGDIIYNENELIKRIELLLKSNYYENTDDFSKIFDYRDHNNSKRVYKAILEKLK
ncbi:CDP-glycerol glycerophosphotransferase family protein [Staphylococcus xylosus]|uniref:CDP-glycerol glycerophosphotransferase family protein n=1 Tax=Staphylococcus xylosus TaxID=1288 RepID=UPI0030C572F7